MSSDQPGDAVAMSHDTALLDALRDADRVAQRAQLALAEAVLAAIDAIPPELDPEAREEIRRALIRSGWSDRVAEQMMTPAASAGHRIESAELMRAAYVAGIRRARSDAAAKCAERNR